MSFQTIPALTMRVVRLLSGMPHVATMHEMLMNAGISNDREIINLIIMRVGHVLHVHETQKLTQSLNNSDPRCNTFIPVCQARLIIRNHP